MPAVKTYSPAEAVLAVTALREQCDLRGRSKGRLGADFEFALYAVVEHLDLARKTGAIERRKYDYHMAHAMLSALGLPAEHAIRYCKPIAGHVRSWFGDNTTPTPIGDRHEN